MIDQLPSTSLPPVWSRAHDETSRDCCHSTPGLFIITRILSCNAHEWEWATHGCMWYLHRYTPTYRSFWTILTHSQTHTHKHAYLRRWLFTSSDSKQATVITIPMISYNIVLLLNKCILGGIVKFTYGPTHVDKTSCMLTNKDSKIGELIQMVGSLRGGVYFRQEPRLDEYGW